MGLYSQTFYEKYAKYKPIFQARAGKFAFLQQPLIIQILKLITNIKYLLSTKFKMLIHNYI